MPEPALNVEHHCTDTWRNEPYSHELDNSIAPKNPMSKSTPKTPVFSVPPENYQALFWVDAQENTKNVTITEPPATILLRGLPVPELKISEPLRLDILVDKNATTVWSADLKLYGLGSNFEEALETFGFEMAELYYEMKENEEKLGAQAMKIWQFLKSVVKVKNKKKTNR